jgi:CRISPR/Cas system CSM-associated protein Csm3 (group 7 of RAMP superfamily)
MKSAMPRPVPSPPAFSDWPLRFVARVTLALRTPAVIRSGRDPGPAPDDFVRDANGLPALPGTSLCGILRHACLEYLVGQGLQRQAAQERTESVFGVSAADQGCASRLTLSWGRIHDATDCPVDGLLAPQDVRLDCPVLADARVGMRRPHVRIGPGGTADGRGKFEELVVAAGHRFTFDLVLRGDADDAGIWETMLHLLRDPALRLGAGTRRGFGALAIVRVHAGCFDLRTPEAFRAFCALPVRLDAPAALPPVGSDATSGQPQVAVTLRRFRPATPWVFGGGMPEGDEAIAPMTGTIIRWQDGRGAPSSLLPYLPASAIKGALAHRLAWHYNRITGRRAGAGTDTAAAKSLNPAVACLLGHVAEHAEPDAAAGRRGLLLLDEVELTAPAASQEVHHVSLDRFSGGVRNGLLFTERVLAPAALSCDYRIVLRLPPGEPPIATPIRQAFAAVLEDVRKARLAFGSGGGRGNGRFLCDSVEWEDGGQWLESGDAGPQQGVPARG